MITTPWPLLQFRRYRRLLGRRGPGVISLACLSSYAALSSVLAADNAGPTLDVYLKQLRYEPIELRRNDRYEWLVRAEFGGRKRVFLVDTGCGMTTLDPRSARGLKTLGELNVTLQDKVLGRMTNGDFVLITNLSLGRAQFFNQPAQVRTLAMDFVANSFDGILGCDFFMRNFCVLDCRAARLYVRATKPSDQESKALDETLRRCGFAEVPLSFEGYLEVEAEANGDKPLRLIVDTGSFLNILDESQLRWLSLSAIKPRDLYPGALGLDESGMRVIGIDKIGGHDLSITTLNKFRIGAREWKAIHFGAANLKAWKPVPSTNEFQGILGGDMLATQGALIDFSSGSLWLGPQKSALDGKP